MSGLRQAAERAARMGRLPLANSDRLLECEKVATRLAGLATAEARSTEEWDAFLQRIGVIDG